MSDRHNPADLQALTRTHWGPLFACCAALVARRAEIYRIQSAPFRTSGKETGTWFARSRWTSGGRAQSGRLPRRTAGRRLSSWAARGRARGPGGPAALAGRRTAAGSRFASASTASLAATTSVTGCQHQRAGAGAIGKTHAGHHTHPGRRCQRKYRLLGLRLLWWVDGNTRCALDQRQSRG